MSRRGFCLFCIALITAGIINSIDVSLVFLSAPSLVPVAAPDIQSLQWTNDDKIQLLMSQEQVLQGSFSRAILFSSQQNDVEFDRQASLSLERTDFLDFSSFNAKLPAYNGTFFECDASELWRIVCKVYTVNRLYQFKLRLDVLTDDNNAYFVPVTDFDTTINATNSVESYLGAIRDQLGIDATVNMRNSTRFKLDSKKQPPENITLRTNSSATVLTHDALATLFLKTIRIFAGEKNNRVRIYRRRAGTRNEELAFLRGNMAKSQRPYMPLIPTAFFYLALAFLSFLVQFEWQTDPVSRELDILIEILGLSKSEGVFNMPASSISKVVSETTRPAGSYISCPRFQVTHNNSSGEDTIRTEGHLPVEIMLLLTKYLNDRKTLSTTSFAKEWEIK